MLTNIENYSWLIILSAFGLLFMKIWDTLKKYSSFSESTSFVIALCVSMLCVISVIGFFSQGHENSQEIALVHQEDPSSQEPQQHKFHLVLLPYMALIMSFLLLLMMVKIELLADSVNSFFRAPCRKKDKVITTGKQNNLKQIKPK
jgi:Ca2+/Na+ antiporter